MVIRIWRKNLLRLTYLLIIRRECSHTFVERKYSFRFFLSLYSKRRKLREIFLFPNYKRNFDTYLHSNKNGRNKRRRSGMGAGRKIIRSACLRRKVKIGEVKLWRSRGKRVYIYIYISVCASCHAPNSLSLKLVNWPFYEAAPPCSVWFIAARWPDFWYTS